MALNSTCKDKKKSSSNSMLLCCKFFVSESRNREALNLVEVAAQVEPDAVIVKKFDDRTYNRARYDLVSYILRDSTGCPVYSPLHRAVVAMVDAAYGAINLESHSGAHPRLGAVDDILFHPLAQATLDDAAWLAKAVANEIGNQFQVPVYLYGYAHPMGKALDTIRRELDYYRPNHLGCQWAGRTVPETVPVKPDMGPEHVSRARGVVTIGACPWVTMYNVPILTTDVTAARKIARAVSARGGGLPTVQTMALFHGDDAAEIACILLEPNRLGADRVQNQVELLAAREGLDVERGYFTSWSPEMIIEAYSKLVSDGSRM